MVQFAIWWLESQILQNTQLISLICFRPSSDPANKPNGAFLLQEKESLIPVACLADDINRYMPDQLPPLEHLVGHVITE